MAGRQTYDVDPVQKEILLHRHARRQMLREKYLEQIHNPYRYAADQGGYVEDIAISRWQSMRLSMGEFFKPNWKNGGWFFLMSVVPVGITMCILKTARDRQEHKLRTGQISYRDREYKFH